MTVRYLVASAAVTIVVLLAVALTDLSFQRATLLAPVLVIGLAAAAGLLVFWGKVGAESLRNAKHPRLIVATAALVLGVLIVLSFLGVKLPHE